MPNNVHEYGPVMLDIAGPKLTDMDLRRLQNPLVGGLILFTRNYQSTGQLFDLVKEVRALRPTNFLIAVDQEGGRVQRFRGEGFTRLPPPGWFAREFEIDPENACQLARDVGWLMATELRAYDIDFSFAPVLDLNLGVSEVIGDRSFGAAAEQVTALSYAFMDGMHSAGMAAVGKHFPGHGSVKPDSHIAMPIDNRMLAEVQCLDLVPFKALIDKGIEGIMPAHIVFEKIDGKPAGFSSFWLKDILRKELNFKGAIFSDDLSMKGASSEGDATTRVAAALKAGCDMILMCNQPDMLDMVLCELSSIFIRNRDDAVVCARRLKRMEGKVGASVKGASDRPDAIRRSLSKLADKYE